MLSHSSDKFRGKHARGPRFVTSFLNRINFCMVEQCERVERLGLQKMLGRQVSVPHCCGEVLVAKDLLEGKDVAPCHHEVAGERVPENVRHLAIGKVDARPLDTFAEGSPRVPEYTLQTSVILVVLFQGAKQVVAQGHYKKAV